MKNLLKKVRGDKKGFTLAELLVVVAIVGILVAISVPLFTAQLGKARQATNNANLRAAKVAAVAQYMTDDAGANATKYYDYNTKTGVATSVKENAATNKTESVTINSAGVSKSEVYSTITVKVTGTDTTDASVELYVK